GQGDDPSRELRHGLSPFHGTKVTTARPCGHPSPQRQARADADARRVCARPCLARRARGGSSPEVHNAYPALPIVSTSSALLTKMFRRIAAFTKEESGSCDCSNVCSVRRKRATRHRFPP